MNMINEIPSGQAGFIGMGGDLAVQRKLGLAPPIEIVDRNGKIKQGAFVRAPLELLNVVVQARDEYQDIDVLAENIREKKRLIHTPLIARYSKEGASAYLDAAYEAYGKKVPVDQRRGIDDLVKSDYDGKGVYLIVISGHRRLRSLKMLGQQDIIVQIVDDIDPLDALELQASENTAKLPKDYERAESNGRLYTIKKIRSPKLTIREFAASVGQRENVARRDLRYYNLPDEVKNYVVPRNRKDRGEGNTEIPDQPLMPFSVACQLGRLVEAGAPKSEILMLALNFFRENITSEKTARERVSKYLTNFNSGAKNMADIFGISLQQLARVRGTREAAKRFAGPADIAIGYFARVEQSLRLGLPGTDEDGVSFTGAAGRIVTLAEVMEGLLPHMRSLLTGERSESVKEVLKEMRRLAEGVEENIGAGGVLFPQKPEKVSGGAEIVLFQSQPLKNARE